MRPDSSPDPAVETLEELADVGAFIILTPTPQERIKPRNQFLGSQRCRPFGALPYLVNETANRLLLGIRIERILLGLTTNLAPGQIKLPPPALDFVAEELEAVSDVNNPRLLRMELHAQLFQDSAGRVHGGSGLCCRSTGDHPVIGKPRQLISSQSHLPIKWRQKYVTEHGRNPTTLWSASLARKELPFAVASRFEHRLDEAQHSAVSYSLSYQREELFMVRGPEEVSEIRIDDPL